MTRKSEARRDRDKVEKEFSTCWDDLTNIYDTCVISLNTAMFRLKELYSDEHIRYFLTNKKELAILLRGVGKDKKELQQRLDVIYAKHSSRTGGLTKEEREGFDMGTLELGQEYSDWNMLLQTTLIPNTDYLIMQYGSAYERMVAYIKANQPQEETTVTT